MAQVKGKFITLTGMLASSSGDIIKKIDRYLEEQTGLTHLELDPEEFYDVSLWRDVMNFYSSTSLDPKKAIINLGRRIYPSIKHTTGLPPNLKTPRDFIVFEAEGFRLNHSQDVEQRKILDESKDSVTIYAPAPGYDESLFVGVWLGILETIGISTGKVEEVSKSTYKVSWCSVGIN